MEARERNSRDTGRRADLRWGCRLSPGLPRHGAWGVRGPPAHGAQLREGGRERGSSLIPRGWRSCLVPRVPRTKAREGGAPVGRALLLCPGPAWRWPRAGSLPERHPGDKRCACGKWGLAVCRLLLLRVPPSPTCPQFTACGPYCCISQRGTLGPQEAGWRAEAPGCSPCPAAAPPASLAARPQCQALEDGTLV